MPSSGESVYEMAQHQKITPQMIREAAGLDKSKSGHLGKFFGTYHPHMYIVGLIMFIALAIAMLISVFGCRTGNLSASDCWHSLMSIVTLGLGYICGVGHSSKQSKQ